MHRSSVTMRFACGISFKFLCLVQYCAVPYILECMRLPFSPSGKREGVLLTIYPQGLFLVQTTGFGVGMHNRGERQAHNLASPERL